LTRQTSDDAITFPHGETTSERQDHRSRLVVSPQLAPPQVQVDRRAVLTAEGLTKRYGHVVALDNASISLYEGEVVALVGDNGAGKSTLVSILSGVNLPDSGVLLIDDQEVRLDNPRKAQASGVATVFQTLALVDRRDVAANLFLGREPRRYGIVVDRKRMQRDASRVISELGVGLPSVRAPVADLSGGQRQAVAVARAVLQGGRIMLFDEPTAALGVREGGQVLDLIRTLRVQRHAVLLVSHNIVSVFDVSDRIVVMRHGRVVATLRTSETTHDEIVSMIVGARGAAA
jgi:D-xylose transport system ATP-binding protein